MKMDMYKEDCLLQYLKNGNFSKIPQLTKQNLLTFSEGTSIKQSLDAILYKRTSLKTKIERDLKISIESNAELHDPLPTLNLRKIDIVGHAGKHYSYSDLPTPVWADAFEPTYFD